MKLTFSMLQTDILRNIGLANDTTPANVAFINTHLQTRYQDLLAAFANWRNSQSETATTEEGVQYYSYPPDVISIEAATVAQGSIVYPIVLVNSQEQWNYINQYPNTNTFIPQFIFPRQYDFGIWPIPQGEYTMTLNYVYTDKPLNIPDYTTGTVSVTNGSLFVTSSGATFTTSMAGRWFTLTETNQSVTSPKDYWYKIAAVDDATDTLTLQNFWQGSTQTTQTYVIGQAPSLPDEAHILLSWGVTSDWFALHGDPGKAAAYNNMYYTGDPQNSKRDSQNTQGGLIGLRNRYAERGNKRVVYFNSKRRIGFFPEWVNQILPSS